jgi:hypothetical protein
MMKSHSSMTICPLRICQRDFFAAPNAAPSRRRTACYFPDSRQTAGSVSIRFYNRLPTQQPHAGLSEFNQTKSNSYLRPPYQDFGLP